MKKGPRGLCSDLMEIAPNLTLYVNNLDNKISKPDLRLNLYLLFSTYGTVLDVVALKTEQMSGQAHIVFNNIGSASAAMRACDGAEFFGKQMRVRYAKGKSDVISKLEGTYVPRQTTSGTKGALPRVKREREESDDEEEDE